MANTSTKYGVGFVKRAIARIIDYIWGYALSFVFGLILGILVVVLFDNGIASLESLDTFTFEFTIMSLVFGNLGYFFYNVLCEWLYGATLGKLILGIRVMSISGKRCSLKQAIMRSIGFFVDALFFGLVAYSSMSSSQTNQRYGDKWAGTVVVKTHQVPSQARRSILLFILSVVIGSFVNGMLALIPTILAIT